MDFYELTIRVAANFDWTDDAAEYTIDTYLRLVVAIDNRTIDRDSIADDDVAFLIGAVGSAQSAGDLGQQELFRVQDCVPEVERAQTLLAHWEAQRNEAIKAALNAGARVKDVAAVAGLSRQRVAQIRQDAR